MRGRNECSEGAPREGSLRTHKGCDAKVVVRLERRDRTLKGRSITELMRKREPLA